MHNTREITQDLIYVGVSNRRMSLFENVFPVNNGASYNSFLLKDEKTVLIDAVDESVYFQFLENLEFALDGRNLDYLIVNHMEPDHTFVIAELVKKYPDITIICNQKSKTMIKQFFDFDIDSRAKIVTEGEIFNTGKHSLTFVMAPMVHWPEVMVTFDLTDNILFSADAFGTFGALNGNIFADEMDFERDYLPEARRYYSNIVGKYGMQVQALLKKAANLDIKMICPLHGPIWRNKIDWYIEKYQKWSTFEPEEETALILYATVYGHTENVASIIAEKLASKGVKNIKMYDVSKTHTSYLVAEAFRCSHIIIASTTYNAGIFCNMETILNDLKAHNIQNRRVAIIENGSWAPTAGNLIKKMFENLKNIEYVEPVFTIKSSVKPSQEQQLQELADSIFNSMVIKPNDTNPMFKISYGLYTLFAKENDKDNACIINTVTQLTDTPKQISICVNKNNLTCEMIRNTGKFNVSVLTEETPFSLFKRFGFSCGRNENKFQNFTNIKRQDNGILSLTKYSNATLCAKVVSQNDLGTHIMFIAEVIEDEIISDVPAVTYTYYLNKIKPVVRAEKNKVGFVCKICGWVYEGAELPKDIVCPLCKHGYADFEPLKQV